MRIRCGPVPIVTDVCGVKQSVVEAVEGILAQAGVRYVGAHPMAGREFSGYDYTTDSLFRGASFILTPTEASDPEAVETLRAFAIELGFGRVVLATRRSMMKKLPLRRSLRTWCRTPM